MEAESNDDLIRSSNASFVTENVLKMRLDTSHLLSDIESVLRGFETVVAQDEQGNLIVQKVKTGVPKCNAKGVQGIKGRVGMIINPSVVQGNYKEDFYREEICRIRKSLAKHVMKNVFSWDVDEAEYEGIVDSIMDVVKPYLSRLINNKERDSYTNSIRHTENRSLKQNESSSGLLGFK